MVCTAYTQTPVPVVVATWLWLTSAGPTDQRHHESDNRIRLLLAPPTPTACFHRGGVTPPPFRPTASPCGHGSRWHRDKGRRATVTTHTTKAFVRSVTFRYD